MSITPIGCAAVLPTTQPFDRNIGVNSAGSATATLASFIGETPMAHGTCTIAVTPASGSALTFPVIGNP